MSLDYVLKPESVAVAVLDPKTRMPDWMTMHASHPSFKSIVRALKGKKWSKVPRLFDMAQLIADKSQGHVEVKKDGIFYKGTMIDNSLTQRMIQMIKEGKSVNHMLRFMDNLMRNPSEAARNELYDWLRGSKLPITDDGRFTAYKRVRNDYKDMYTGTIDNSTGQIVFMKRGDVCTDRNVTCAIGLHFCSVAYLPSYLGDRVMQLVVNPADVVSIPNDYQFTKGRTWTYEVVKEVPQNELSKLFDTGIDIDDFQTSVYSIAKDSKKLRADIFALPTIKSMLRFQQRIAKSRKSTKRGRKAKSEKYLVSAQSIKKMTYGRLVNLYKQFAPPEVPKVNSAEFFDAVQGINRLVKIRDSYGFSRGMIAEQMGKPYSTVYGYETAKFLAQDTIDAYIDAIMKLTKVTRTMQSGVTYPKVAVKAQAAAASVGSSPTPVGAYTTADGGSFLDDEETDEFGYVIDEDTPF